MQNQKNTSKKPKPDILVNIKYKGYCRSQTAPGDKTTLEDFTKFAKFFLCKQTRTLWNDPVWDKYSDEEIMIEYFSHLFASSEEERKAFEVQIDAGVDLYGEDVYAWLDRKIAENQAETKKMLESLPQKVSFSPDGVDKEE